MDIDEAKLGQFVNKLVGDMGATMSSILVVIGDRLGLWKTMAARGPVTIEELARSSECSERYIREWLNAQASAGYVTYDPSSTRYTLPPEHAVALAEEGSPAFFAGAFEVAAAAWASVDKATQNFRTGGGLEWGHQHPCLFQGTERFFRSAYLGNLVQAWLPSLDGVVERLTTGAKVADIGCGVGASTILMAQAYPQSTFHGFDYHAGSIDLARKRALTAGVADRVRFDVARTTDFPGKGYDLVACFDCLHDLPDPFGTASHVRQVLAKDGTWLIVEPFASDRPEDNHNPVGRVYYSSSTMLCVPHSLAEGGPALGAQAGEARLREVVTKGGFTRFRQTMATPFNFVLEARL